MSTPGPDEQLTIEKHLVEMRAEISRLANDASINPVYRFGFQKALEKAIQDTLGRDMEPKHSKCFNRTREHIPSMALDLEASRHQKMPMLCELHIESNVDYHEFSVVETFFGNIYIESKSTSRKTQVTDKSLDSRTLQYENSKTLVFRPAKWLISLGLSYSLHVGIRESAVTGWTHTIAINRPVPDNALVFEFAEQGNLPAMRSLMSRGLASVRDFDSYGRTALWVS